MVDVQIVQRFHSGHDLQENVPDLRLLEKLPLFLVVRYLLIQVSIVGELHNDAT